MWHIFIINECLSTSMVQRLAFFFCTLKTFCPGLNNAVNVEPE